MDRRASTFSLLARIAAWSVVFGIVLEDWDIFGIAWKHHFPYLIREAVGGVIVAVAIALEIRFSSLEASAERKIRDWYALRVAELNVRADGLLLDIANANVRANEADERSKSLEKDNLLLRAEVLKLQEAASWRDFSKAQRDQMLSLVEPYRFQPAPSIEIDSVVGNPEAKRYGTQLATALSEAIGAPIRPPLGLSPAIEYTGVWVFVSEHSADKASADANAISNLLDFSGVKDVQLCKTESSLTPNTIKIIVGSKG